MSEAWMAVPLRLLLPLGHLAVDVVILGVWILRFGALNEIKRSSSEPRYQAMLILQEGAAVSFDPAFLPEEILVIGAGNLPAMLITDAVWPIDYRVKSRNAWDSLWLAMYAALSSLAWFGLGALLDSGRLRIRKSMLAYLVLRGVLAVVLLVSGSAEGGWRLEMLCWFAFGASILGIGTRKVLRRLLPPQLGNS